MRVLSPRGPTPMVVAQAVPSDVQSTVGSVWKASPGASGSVVRPQVAPPSMDQYCAWAPLPPRLLEAAMIRRGFLKSTRTSDSLRGTGEAPETRTLDPAAAAFAEGTGRASRSRGPGRRSGCVVIHSWISFRARG